ncbi:MAG: type II and III secretion system protein [Ignavibacteriae bacterium]|nr:type II and III secretion system protein [Ignavibacteriota bacterium]
MKTKIILATCALAVLSLASASAQQNPAERRALKEYTSPDELVSIAPTTSLARALAAISEVSKRFTGKVIIDPERREAPIGVNVTGLQWRVALETICRKMNLWYDEYPNYIQLLSLGAEPGGTGATASATGEVVDFTKEAASFKSREIKISAVFFEVSLTKLDEVGINWSFMKSNKDFSVASSFSGADRVSNDIFQIEATPKLSFANISAVARVFSSYDLGEVLSGPQLIVRSGEKGRIQVGQDFSIKERDFAGNLIDRFYSTGTIIDVQPQVISEQGQDFIHMKVDVERSSLVPSAGSTIINKTKANTNVLLLDNEETIIGGLYNNEVSEIRAGIPLLKDLPWYVLGLRYLFGYNKEEVRKKELIILLKAELVPTLQNRVAQKVRESGVFQQWEKDVERQADHVTGQKETR